MKTFHIVLLVAALGIGGFLAFHFYAIATHKKERDMFRQFADTGVAPEGLDVKQATPTAAYGRRRYR